MQHSTRLGWLDSTGGADEQIYSDLRLEPGNLLAYYCLGDAETFCGSCERAGFDYRGEVGQAIEVDGLRCGAGHSRAL
jgi:hypothetical protein